MIWVVQMYREKYFALSLAQISSILAPSHASEGRLENVTDAGWDAVDAKAALDGRRRSGRQNRVVLTPRRWRQVFAGSNSPKMTGAKEPGPRGERDISRKTIAQGRPDVSANPWFLTRVLTTLHTRLRVH